MSLQVVVFHVLFSTGIKNVNQKIWTTLLQRIYWGALRRYDWRLRDHVITTNRYNEFHSPKMLIYHLNKKINHKYICKWISALTWKYNHAKCPTQMISLWYISEFNKSPCDLVVIRTGTMAISAGPNLYLEDRIFFLQKYEQENIWLVSVMTPVFLSYSSHPSPFSKADWNICPFFVLHNSFS